jgi:BirA family transcriptional regulator, biotin operon repressor / biotin---[acetyl-CoA-carboxylase] ligase
MNKSLNLLKAEAFLEALAQHRRVDSEDFQRWGGETLVSKLQELGVPLVRKADDTYVLTSMTDFLDEERIRSSMDRNISDRLIIQCLQITDSTNAQLMRCEIPDDTYVAITSELQTEGRGRRGRQWVASYGQQMAFSLGFRTMDKTSTGIIPLNAALSVRSALTSLGYEGIGIKWPNDLYVGGRKVGGILVEAVMDRHRQKVVVGIGINLAHNNQMEDQVDQPVAFLGSVLRESSLSRSRVTAVIIETLVKELSHPISGAALQREWSEVDICRGQQVKVITASGELQGMGAGIGLDGEFILETPAGESRFHSGEISLRLKQ